jgi:hypothetical protein
VSKLMRYHPVRDFHTLRIACGHKGCGMVFELPLEASCDIGRGIRSPSVKGVPRQAFLLPGYLPFWPHLTARRTLQ